MTTAAVLVRQTCDGNRASMRLPHSAEFGKGDQRIVAVERGPQLFDRYPYPLGKLAFGVLDGLSQLGTFVRDKGFGHACAGSGSSSSFTNSRSVP